MNCFPLVTNDSFEGELVVWARRRLRKRGRSRAKFQMWYQIWTAEADFTLSFSPQKVTWLIWKIHVQILQTIRPLGSLHGNQAIVCHCLSFGAMVFPPHCLREMSTVSFFFFFFLSPSVFSSSSSLSSVPVSPHRCRNPFVVQWGQQQNQGMWGKLPLQQEHQIFSLLTEHPAFSPQDSRKAQWRRAGEYDQTKQKRFALERARWESCCWLVDLWPSKIALL